MGVSKKKLSLIVTLTHANHSTQDLDDMASNSKYDSEASLSIFTMIWVVITKIRWYFKGKGKEKWQSMKKGYSPFMLVYKTRTQKKKRGI